MHQEEVKVMIMGQSARIAYIDLPHDPLTLLLSRGDKMRECSICGSDQGKIRSFRGSKKDYCPKHYSQMVRYGKILLRTRYDPNEIRIKDDYAELILYNDNGTTEISITLISLESVAIVSKHKWHLHKGYVQGKVNNKNIYLARFLMNETNPKILIDHKNGKPLDNQLSNLRRSTTQTNTVNQKKIKGVRKVGNKWYARIRKDKKEYTKGGFNTQGEAITARNILAKELYGEFAPILEGGI